MIRKFNHITDYLMTEEMARERLCADQIDVTWYTNKTNTESVLHSHPYYEAILPISGEVLYSVNGSLYRADGGFWSAAASVFVAVYKRDDSAGKGCAVLSV